MRAEEAPIDSLSVTEKACIYVLMLIDPLLKIDPLVTSVLTVESGTLSYLSVTPQQRHRNRVDLSCFWKLLLRKP